MNVESESTEANYRLPSSTTLQHVSKLSIVEDKPIMTMYDKDINKANLVA